MRQLFNIIEANNTWSMEVMKVDYCVNGLKFLNRGSSHCPIAVTVAHTMQR